MKTFRELVGEAVGEASMCWSETPKGIFDSTKASELTDRIVKSYQVVQLEAIRLRDALEKHVHNGHLGPQSCWFCKVLTELPHTSNLAKQREADLKVIEAAKNVQCSCELASRLSGHNIDCTTWPMYEALDERERIYKGEI